MLVLDKSNPYVDFKFVELTDSENAEIEGGFLPILIAAACLLLANSCKVNIDVNVHLNVQGGHHNNQTNLNHADSTSHR